jgi:hypothetical protein
VLRPIALHICYWRAESSMIAFQTMTLRNLRAGLAMAAVPRASADAMLHVMPLISDQPGGTTPMQVAPRINKVSAALQALLHEAVLGRSGELFAVPVYCRSSLCLTWRLQAFVD